MYIALSDRAHRHGFVLARSGVENKGSPDGTFLVVLPLPLFRKRALRDANTDRADILRELHSSYLFKDILEIGGIRQPRKIVDLVRLLAWQVGSEASFSELGGKLGMSKDTVANYVDLLEKSFILFRLQPHSRNLRSEVVRSPKIYFADNGVRNAAIGDFREFSQRNDRGELWENFVVSERRKRLLAAGVSAESRYWRLRTGAEIDYVEERGGSFAAGR